MKKFFILLSVIGVYFFLGCSDGGGGVSSTSEPAPAPVPIPIPTPFPTLMPHFIEVDDFAELTVPIDTADLSFTIVVKDNRWNDLPNILVRAEFDEFYSAELEAKMRVQNIRTNIQGKAEFLIPQYYEAGERNLRIWLPDFPEVEAIMPTVKYILPGIPNRLVVADPAQAEISLLLGESVEVIFAVLDADDNPIQWIEGAVVEGAEYVSSPTTAESNEKGEVSFLFTASDIDGSAVLRARIVECPLIFAEAIISWTEGPTGVPSILEIVNVSKWEGDLPVIVIEEDAPFDILFKVTDANRYPVEGALVQSEFPAGSSALTDAYGLATITVPPGSRPQGVDTARAWVTNYGEVFIEFKIEYLF